MTEVKAHPTLAELAKACYENSADHGFWDQPETVETIPNKLMLIVSEISEALESYRDPAADGLVKVPVDVLEDLISAARSTDPLGAGTSEIADVGQAILDKWQGKPKGYDTELADALIRIFDLAGRKGIDLEAAVLAKHDFNKGRPRMHGRLV